jgi:4-amino-4-deoxy-L-arabinose transferase-like glycosyltransferase
MKSLPQSTQSNQISLASMGLFILFGLIAIWRHHIGADLPLSVDEAYYVAWSKSLDWGYWTKPPVIAWAIAAARSVCGETASCIRSTSLIAFPLTSLALLVLCHQMGKSLVSACMTAAIFATLPLSSFYGIAATTDAFLLLFWACGMLCLWLAIEGKFWAWPLLGLSFGLGLLSKYTMVIFGLSAVMVLMHPRWRHTWKFAGPYLALVFALVVFAPNVLWNLSHHIPTFQHTADISQGGNAYGLHWDMLGKFLLEQVLLGNPLLVICWGLIFVIQIKKPTHQNWFVLSASLPVLFVICLQALLSRAHANWAAPAYLGICVASVGHLWPSKKKTIATALAFNALFAASLYHYQTLIAKPFGLRGSIASDPFWAVRPWPQLIAQVEIELARQSQKPSWKIASEDRAVLAQAQAILNLTPGSALGWQRQTQPDNHFEQHFPLLADIKTPVLLLTNATDDQVKQTFPNALKRDSIHSQGTIESVSYKLWWLGL